MRTAYSLSSLESNDGAFWRVLTEGAELTICLFVVATAFNGIVRYQRIKNALLSTKPLRRFGRLDREVALEVPDEAARREAARPPSPPPPLAVDNLEEALQAHRYPVVVLRNLYDIAQCRLRPRRDFLDELEGEIRGECGKFGGSVVGCVAPKHPAYAGAVAVSVMAQYWPWSPLWTVKRSTLVVGPSELSTT